MKLRSVILLGALFSGIGMLLWSGTSPAVAGDELIPAAAAATLPALSDDEPAYSYVGSKKCKKCHIKEYKSWAKTKMGLALETLKPEQAKEAKEKSKLDVSKDYTQDKTCLKCHTTAYDKPGGYAIPDPDDKKAVKQAKKLAGVGCESCHGPGSEYIKVFDEIMESKRKYKAEELYAVGMLEIDESTCKACHNEDSPTVASGEPFDYEKNKEEGIHEHLPLKQREE